MQPLGTWRFGQVNSLWPAYSARGQMFTYPAHNCIARRHWIKEHKKSKPTSHRNWQCLRRLRWPLHKYWRCCNDIPLTAKVRLFALESDEALVNINLLAGFIGNQDCDLLCSEAVTRWINQYNNVPFSNRVSQYQRMSIRIRMIESCV